MQTAPMQQEGPDGGDHSMCPRVASPVSSATSTEGVVMRGYHHMANYRYEKGREFLADVCNMLRGIVQLLIDHLPQVVSLPATERHMKLIKPCASRSASYAVRATHLEPTDEIAKSQRIHVSRKAEAMRKDAQWFVRVQLDLRCDGSVHMNIETSPFSSAHKYKDVWMEMNYWNRDVLRNNSTRPILCYLYHHLERMDEVLQCRLDDFDRQVEFDEPSEEENATYFELLALFNSALLLKLASILRSCVTMFFHTTFTSIDCDGHATFLHHLLARIQIRSVSMRMKARTSDNVVEEEPDTTFTHRAAKRPRYEDGYSDSCAFTYSPREAARYYCEQNRDHFTQEMATFLEDL